MQFSPSEEEIVTDKITISSSKKELLVLVECDFISTIYVHPKKDGIFRNILNLKNLIEFVLY